MSLEGEEKVRTGTKLDDVEAKRAARLVLCVALIVSLLILCWIQLDMSTQWGADCFAFFQTMPVEFMVLSVFTLGAPEGASRDELVYSRTSISIPDLNSTTYF